ncbi:hypothetical protein RB2654_14785 [Rhodobacterales bacterium HTCC2654]|uniref:Uncharacterized protein n=1 Tax=Maritimibacter alkaliphilus HTCC2654 TaxID=314271 RepID=A3VH06_9RHOB|nr:hypothetical protein RB2654_14785 [Rhodobacterales bacterium HTCC2654] [Maritimibacter alkaliphilus HTCC2654]
MAIIQAAFRTAPDPASPNRLPPT